MKFFYCIQYCSFSVYINQSNYKFKVCLVGELMVEIISKFSWFSKSSCDQPYAHKSPCITMTNQKPDTWVSCYLEHFGEGGLWGWCLCWHGFHCLSQQTGGFYWLCKCTLLLFTKPVEASHWSATTQYTLIYFEKKLIALTRLNAFFNDCSNSFNPPPPPPKKKPQKNDNC